MIPEFQNGSGIPELSPEWFWNPEPFWNAPKYVLFHIFYIAGLCNNCNYYFHSYIPIAKIVSYFFLSECPQDMSKYNAQNAASHFVYVAPEETLALRTLEWYFFSVNPFISNLVTCL